MVYSVIVSEEKTSDFSIVPSEAERSVRSSCKQLWRKRHKKDKNGKELETWVFKKGEEPVRPNRSRANILRRRKEITKSARSGMPPS